MRKQTKIGIVGLWHLGCVLSVVWSKLGFRVVGFDYSKKIVESLIQDIPPIFEPHLKEMIKNARNRHALSFTNKIKLLNDCDFIFLAYDTPILDNDKSDLTVLKRAVNDLGNILKDGAIFIVSSQVPVGTCKEFRVELQKKNPTLELVYSPENLRLGEAIKVYLNPKRIIIGADSDHARNKAISLFKNIQSRIITMNIASAEMVKHAINAFLANSIVFANHLADLCEVEGADIVDVLKGVKTDPRIGKKAYLSPGIGFSGGTLGRDLYSLSKLNKSAKQESYLFESILKFNSERKKVIVNKVIDLLQGKLAKKTISILGLTYKPETSTLRRSTPLEIAQLLAEKNAKLQVYDPKANYQELSKAQPFKICSSIDEAIFSSDLILLLTEWDEFKEYDWEKGAKLVRNKVFFDPKNFLYDINLPEKGYRYLGSGFIK